VHLLHLFGVVSERLLQFVCILRHHSISVVQLLSEAVNASLPNLSLPLAALVIRLPNVRKKPDQKKPNSQYDHE
jgi:hypothetical protein